jgi:hypothetical protein
MQVKMSKFEKLRQQANAPYHQMKDLEDDQDSEFDPNESVHSSRQSHRSQRVPAENAHRVPQVRLQSNLLQNRSLLAPDALEVR